MQEKSRIATLVMLTLGGHFEWSFELRNMYATAKILTGIAVAKGTLSYSVCVPVLCSSVTQRVGYSPELTVQVLSQLRDVASG